jgi:GAF domain-containing protein
MLFAVILMATAVVGFSRRSAINALRQAFANERELAKVNRELQDRSDKLQARTQDLGLRSRQLQIVAEISRNITAVRELSELLDLAVNLVKERFDFYRVAIFLTDEYEKYAVLRAISGEVGREMADYQVDLEGEDLVSLVIKSGRHRILANASSDDVSWGDASSTEALTGVTLPLRAGRFIIGALDVQSRHAEAFGADDVTVLQTMADQLAVAIENTRLLGEMQQTMRQLEVASGRYTQDSWRMAVQRGGRRMGYRYRRVGVDTIDTPSPEALKAWLEGQAVTFTRTTEAEQKEDTLSTLAIPIKLRDQVVGVVDMNFEQVSVSPETLSLVEEITGRLALALENARLLDETRQRAQRDRLVANITSQVRASMDIERILQTAVRGLGVALNSDRAFIKLGGVQSDADQSEDGQAESEQD